MKVVRFLAPYFRPYWPQLTASLFAAMVYALCTVLMIAIFQVVLSDVLLSDASVTDVATRGLGESGAETAAGAAGADAEAPHPEEPGWIERLTGLDPDELDLEGKVMEAYQGLRVRFGVDESEVLYFVPILMVIVFVTRSLAQFGNGYLFQVIGLGATNDLRVSLYDRILNQSSRFYARHPSGELVSRVANDISVIQNAISTRLIDLFQQVPVAIGIVWYLFSLDASLAVVVFLVVPAVVFPIAHFGKGMRRTSRKSQERLADVSNLVAEAVRGHRVVKAFGMERFELERFRHATLRHLRTRLRAQLLTYASSPVVETIAVIGAGAFLVYAGQAVRRGELTSSELVTFLAAVLMLYDPVRKLNKVNLMLQEALAAGQRVQEVMAESNDIENAPGAIDLPVLEREIRFDGVTFAYGDEAVLREIDLRIPRGQVVALVGHSGAGKSTLVNLLPRFFDPEAGAVRIDGVDIREATLESLRAQIGIVTQDTVLFAGTVRDNIAYGRDDLGLEQVRAAARAAYADDFVGQLPHGYDTEIGEDGAQLSGGQRQRLAIARALLKDPPILILDEATSHLDSEAEALVQKALTRLMEKRTALVIAHRLSTIQRADRILVMDAGRVVEQGTHEELLQGDGIYRHLYDLQFRDGPSPGAAPSEAAPSEAAPSEAPSSEAPSSEAVRG